MEEEPKSEPTNKLQNAEVQKFIANREIKAEDFYLLEKLASFSKNLIVAELHNLFNLYKDESGKTLEVLAGRAKDATKKELFETVLKFYNAYGWIASHNLVRVLERI